MNILFQNPNTPRIILTSVQRINDILLEQCHFYNEFGNRVYVILDTDKQNLRNKPAELRGLNDGFAHKESNYYLSNAGTEGFVHLIVLYYDNCVTAELTEDELVSVLLHELGHAFNDSNDEPVPTLLESFRQKKQYQADEEARVKLKNIFTKECFADYYTRKHGFGEALVSTLGKYNKLGMTPESPMLLDRISILSNTTVQHMDGNPIVLRNK